MFVFHVAFHSSRNGCSYLATICATAFAIAALQKNRITSLPLQNSTQSFVMTLQVFLANVSKLMICKDPWYCFIKFVFHWGESLLFLIQPSLSFLENNQPHHTHSIMGSTLDLKQYCVVWDWTCQCLILTALDPGFLWTWQEKSAYCGDNRQGVWPII